MRRVGFVDVVDARMLVFWRFLVFMVFFDLMIRGESRRDNEGTASAGTGTVSAMEVREDTSERILALIRFVGA